MLGRVRGGETGWRMRDGREIGGKGVNKGTGKWGPKRAGGML
jgi:hypothetical protein